MSEYRPSEALMAMADEIDQLKAVLSDALYFMELHSYRWDGINGKHPQEIVLAARELLRKKDK
jgi:hypothetical protein